VKHIPYQFGDDKEVPGGVMNIEAEKRTADVVHVSSRKTGEATFKETKG
jgi:hypothetical protein